GRVAYDRDYNGLALDAHEGLRIAEVMRRADVVFLANHGVVVTAPTVPEAFNDLYYLERACQLQVLCHATGLPLREVDAATARATARPFLEISAVDPVRHFSALEATLARETPDYRM